MEVSLAALEAVVASLIELASLLITKYDLLFVRPPIAVDHATYCTFSPDVNPWPLIVIVAGDEA